MTEEKQTPATDFTLRDFQQLIKDMYYEKDVERGAEGTFMWLMEEVGELAAAIRGSKKHELGPEFADVLAWLMTIANVKGIDLTEEVHKKYGCCCPGCCQFHCVCPNSDTP